MSDLSRVESRLVQAYLDMKAADIDRLMSLYLPDAIIQGPNAAPISGVLAIRTWWMGIFEQYQVSMTPKLGEATTFGDAIVVRGSAVGLMAPKNGGEAIRVNSWFMQVYRRDANGDVHFWRGANGPNPDTAR